MYSFTKRETMCIAVLELQHAVEYKKKTTLSLSASNAFSHSAASKHTSGINILLAKNKLELLRFAFTNLRP